MEKTQPNNHLAPSSDASSAAESLIEPSKLNIGYFSNQFPQDDLKDLFRRLYAHSKDLQHATLARFIDEATLAVREEVRSLPHSLKSLVPPLQTIFDLANYPELRTGPLGGSVEGVLLCVVQLASLIGYFEDSNNEDFNLDAPNNVDACLAGLGTGLLSAAAVSLSPTLTNLPLAAAETIRVAFRLGVVVDEVSQNLQPRPVDGGHGDSWAYVVPETDAVEVQRELDHIHEVEKTFGPNKIFISAVSRNSVTVSGPPARLKHIFLVSDFFRDHKHVALPVYGGLCHASHIYTREHVEKVVETLSQVATSTLTPRVPVVSTKKGRPFKARTAHGLFSAIVEEIMTQAIEWENVVDAVVERAKNVAASECNVFTHRDTSVPVHELIDALAGGDFKVSTRDVIPWIFHADTIPRGPRGPQQAKIAIVGMSCRMPGGATDTEKFWDILNEGLDVHRKIPADRFDVDSHCDPEGKRVNTSLTPYGCFIDEPGLFDAPFFNMSPREALQTDPMQRLALVTAYEALERAGYVPDRTTDLSRIGTFYGQASDDYREVNTAQEVGTYFITGGCRAFGPGRINYFFKFAGPSYSIDTACSSGLATIHVACNSLWTGDTDMAVCGGMNVLTNSDAFAGLSKGHFLSKTANACKTWDATADGYCRADGVASVVLKRLEDAEAENDNILGVILAAGTNHSANAVSITHPHAGHQGDLTRQLLQQAAVDPLDVQFVEMHGTGTQAGDGEEIQSVADVFAPLHNKRRTPSQPLYIGAVKSNVGHGEAVAGPTALLKTLLMLQKEAIPPHVGIKTEINPLFPKDLDKRNLRIPYERQPWPRVDGRKRIAVVNNFSAAGGNTSIIVEEGPLRALTPDDGVDPRSTHVIAVSAKSKASFKGNLQRMIAYLNTHPDVSLPNLSYTTTARRHHHNHRVAIATSDVAHLQKQLASYVDGKAAETHKPIPPTGAPPVVFAFTGQGASHRSMDLELFHHSPYFRSKLLHLDALSQSQGFPSFIPAVNGSFHKDYMHSPVVMQLATACLEMALAQYWESLGVKPDLVVGHSLGEYAALYTAGVLSATDAILLVGRRAALLEQRCQIGGYKMLAVRASLDTIHEKTERPFEVACINSPNDTVLSGAMAEMAAVADDLRAAGLKCFDLSVDFAFHSAQTDVILDDFEKMAGTALFQPPTIPIISPLLGKVIFDAKTINANYLRRATREPVNFVEAIQSAHRISAIDETMVWIEMGPHPVCMSLVKSIMPSVKAAVPSLRRDEDNWRTMLQSLAVVHCEGVEVGWNELHRPFERSLRLLDLPTYAWNDKTYWIQYNGDWALTKGNTFYDAEKAALAAPRLPAPQSTLQTSLVQRVVEETFSESAGRVVVQSDMMHPDFLAAAWGHQMNGAGVVTSSIHADISFTLAKYLIEKLRPGSKDIFDMDIQNLVVREGLVAQKNTKVPQMIQISITTHDINSNVAHLEWHNLAADGRLVEAEPIVTAQVVYGSSSEWLSSWKAMSHLIESRIKDLERLADEGVANRLSHNMAYQLFASNLVDYADKYRGMQSVVLNGLEAFANVTLKQTDGHGVWTVPPFFVDSVFHLGGFVMNVSDANDTKNNFFVTPGWSSMRMACPLTAGAKYRSYVKMVPTEEDPSIFLGDVYVLHNGDIVGIMRAMKFRRYPRVLLNRFFSAVDVKNPASGTADATSTGTIASIVPAPAPGPPLPVSLPVKPAEPTQPAPQPTSHASKKDVKPAVPIADPNPAPAPAAPAADSDSTAAKAMALVAAESGVDPSDLTDDASFGNLGIDSLMSLVIAEKLRDQLGVTVSGSLFLEYPTVGDLRAWLLEYYS